MDPCILWIFPVFPGLKGSFKRGHWAQKMWRLLIGRRTKFTSFGWHIPILANSDRQGAASVSPQPAPKPVLRAPSTHAAHKHARQSSFPEHTHARLRLFMRAGEIQRLETFWRAIGADSGFRGNLAGSLMSHSYENPLRIMWGLRNDERGLCRGETGDDDAGWQ